MTGKATSTVTAGEPMVAKAVDITATTAPVGLANWGSKSECNGDANSLVVKVMTETWEWECVEPGPSNPRKVILRTWI